MLVLIYVVRVCRVFYNMLYMYLSVDGGGKRCSDAHAHVERSMDVMLVAKHIGDGRYEQADSEHVASLNIVVSRLNEAHQSTTTGAYVMYTCRIRHIN